jgi:hypothetical protein
MREGFNPNGHGARADLARELEVSPATISRDMRVIRCWQGHWSTVAVKPGRPRGRRTRRRAGANYKPIEPREVDVAQLMAQMAALRA